ncbi:antibiotic biosynthesis monooxygenase [Pseudomonas sp. CAU 1711]|uniref:antibiotic biosynthesis monooxygenase n=1 Tax=Pseudomonas sp. CAU 1711 TaxID=3140356 RepID=UPI0032609EB7
MNQEIVSLARFQAREGAGEELGLRLCELLLRARRDPSCRECELCHVQAEEWQLRGCWDSEQALEAHLRLPHMQLLGRLVENGLIRHMELCVEALPVWPGQVLSRSSGG